MSAPGIIDEAARALEQINPDLAARLRSIRIGRPKLTGPSQYNLRMAGLWLEMERRIKSGEEEADVLAQVQQERGWSEDQVDDFWRLAGRPKLRAAIKWRRREKSSVS